MSLDKPATTDPRTAESLMDDLKRLAGVPCTDCRAPLCHHQVLMSIAIGFKDAPRCLPCLGAALDREPAQFRDFIFEYIRQRQCFLDAWNWANRSAGLCDDTMPPALQSLAHRSREVLLPRPSGTLSPGVLQSMARAGMREATQPDAEWDAGDRGCGELVLELRQRLEAMSPGRIFKLCARDPGAPEDLPAWCRLTGHRLMRAEPPNYWIERKANS